MEIVIGADHRGFAHKEYIKYMLAIDEAISWLDVGAHDARRSDYPLFATAAALAVQAGKAQRAILICGSGTGMAVVANRYAGIYAAQVWSEPVARMSKEHDNVNVLVIPSDFVSKQEAVAMVRAWLGATFRGGRYQERITMIDALGGLK